MVYAIFALSLELLVGETGLVSLRPRRVPRHRRLRHRAARAQVRRTVARVAGRPRSLLVAAIAAAAIGALALRTRGVYFIMVTLAFSQMAYYVFHDTTIGGGSDGIYLNVKPTLRARRQRSSISAARRSTT